MTGARRALRRPISLYVHVPFCAARCPYCDFATAPATSTLRARYMAALAREIREQGGALGRPEIRTLYVGGGTPSLLEPGEIASLAAALRDAFDLRPVEATVEANPATLDRARLDAWRALGITRLSLGAQSFATAGLAALGRTHQPGDVAPAVAAARSVGLAVGLDLIFGWPGQTLHAWRADLASAVALGPDHLSCYPLELVLEPEEAVANWPGGGWPSLRRWRERADRAAPRDEAVARLYRIAERSLRAAGYRHYEIANWARPGAECEHNLVYWRNGEWLGVGAGAHSHLGGGRSRRPAALPAYLEAVDRGEPRIPDPHADEAVDAAMLALRLSEGLDLGAYAARFGGAHAARVRGALRDVMRFGLVSVSSDRARLTPRGRLLASEVFVRLLPDDAVATPGRDASALAAT
ncbi:MAG TPA: radical SAM family heme chaperone HemW [Candidatus Limnocylindria bacterium]|nr:radical SAM family heme chaperone HemW [Candidatus Limnocylindria bacterium]